MTPTEVAAQLDGNQYRDEGSMVLFESMKLFGLVAVFGASDDLMEFRGSINDEIGAFGGAFLTKEGLLTNYCDDDNCPYFNKMKTKAATIKAIWDNGGFSFRYETEIPHAKFVIKEDGENYCEGIVFALADVPSHQ